MRRLLHILLVLLLAVASAAAATPRKRTSGDARRQRQQTEKQLAKTSRRITMTEKELSDRLAEISAIEARMERTQARARALKLRLDSIGARSKAVGDSIAANEARLDKLRELYTRAVRSSRRNRREMNSITFIFSATTFRQASRRMGYLEQYSRWRERKTREISAVVAELDTQRSRLEEMKRQTSSLRSQAVAEQRRLQADRKQLDSVVTSLKGRQKELNKILKKQQNTLADLDDEISRLIAREAEEERRRREAEEARRKAEEARLKAEEARRKAEEAAAAAGKAPSGKKEKKKEKTAAPQPPREPVFKPVEGAYDVGGGFSSQRGKLPSPLSHTYIVTRGFGVQRHETISKVEVNNPGIDLETAPTATAKAVYPGVVSAIFVQDGYEHVVLIRHGEYLTVYANVRTLSVKKGDKLKAGDVIGTVAPSEHKAGRGMLHFEIRREREKFDPRLWLRR